MRLVYYLINLCFETG